MHAYVCEYQYSIDNINTINVCLISIIEYAFGLIVGKCG